MKHFLFILFVPLLGQAQIVMDKSPSVELGRVKNPHLLAKISYAIKDGKDTVYTLNFRDCGVAAKSNGVGYTMEYRDISFTGDRSILEQLYKLFKSVYLNENARNKGYEVQFKLGNEEVSVKNYRKLGMPLCTFTTPKGFVYLMDSEIDILFKFLHPI